MPTINTLDIHRVGDFSVRPWREEHNGRHPVAPGETPHLYSVYMPKPFGSFELPIWIADIEDKNLAIAIADSLAAGLLPRPEQPSS